jgi:hypothetical protein
MKRRQFKRLPTPAQIAKRAAEIRARWTERELRKPSGNHTKPWNIPVFRVSTTTRGSDGLEPLEPAD